MTNQPRLTSLLLAGLLTLLLAGCASEGQPKKVTLDEIHEALRDEPAPARKSERTPPSAVSDSLLPPIQLNIPGADTSATEARFDVKVRRANARDFFLGLVEGTRYNMLVHPEVSGSISLDLKNVTVPEVMDVVRDTYGYDYERSGDNFQILPNVLQTRIFQVNYLDITRSGTSKISAGATQISKTAGSGGSSTGDSGSTTTTSETSTITTDSVSNFWQGLEKTLQLIIGNEAGRSVSINPQSGLVVVRAMPAELRDVKRYLDTTQNVTQRQVILEARIVEVELADGFQMGINWGELRDSNGDTALFGFGGTNNATSTQFTESVIAGGAVTRDAGSRLSSSINRAFTLGIYTKDFTGLIDLLKSQGAVQVLSSPRISTMNNQKAVIKVGSDEFFVTDVNTTTTTTSTSTTPNVSVELTPFFSGVTLDVTPQISEGGEIILHVRPSVSDVREQVKDVTVTTTTLRMPLAASSVRESDSVIRAQNGQIVVIGGLMQTLSRDEKSSVPLLGDIPILGALFSHTKTSKVKSELVILLKPTVVDDGRQWSDDIRRSAKGFHQFDQ